MTFSLRTPFVWKVEFGTLASPLCCARASRATSSVSWAEIASLLSMRRWRTFLAISRSNASCFVRQMVREPLVSANRGFLKLHSTHLNHAPCAVVLMHNQEVHASSMPSYTSSPMGDPSTRCHTSPTWAGGGPSRFPLNSGSTRFSVFKLLPARCFQQVIPLSHSSLRT